MKWKKHKWKHGSSTERKDVLIEEAKSIFDHVIKDTYVNRAISVFGRLDENYQEFTPVMEYSERLFTKFPHNHLIVRFFSEYPSMGQLPFFEKRAKEIKCYYPRLRYVLLIDQKAIKVENTRKDFIKQTIEPDGHCIYLKEFDDPFLVVSELFALTLDPKECPGITIAGQGKGI